MRKMWIGIMEIVTMCGLCACRERSGKPQMVSGGATRVKQETDDTKQWHYEEKLYEYMKKIYTQDKEDYGVKYKTGCLGDIRIVLRKDIENITFGDII